MHTAFHPYLPLLTLVAQASASAAAGASVTVWVKRSDVAGARYAEVENVDLQQTVSKFIARWVAQEQLDVRPSLVTLRLVKCGAGKPSESEEAAAVVLDDPSLILAEARVTGTAWLLADTVQLALLAVEREEEVERQRAERRARRRVQQLPILYYASFSDSRLLLTLYARQTLRSLSFHSPAGAPTRPGKWATRHRWPRCCAAAHWRHPPRRASA